MVIFYLPYFGSKWCLSDLSLVGKRCRMMLLRHDIVVVSSLVGNDLRLPASFFLPEQC